MTKATTAAKETILASIRRSSDRRPPAADPPPLTLREIGNLTDTFFANCEACSSNIVPLNAIEQLPAAVARRMSQPLRLRAWSEFAALDWQAVNVDCQTGSAEEGDRYGLTAVSAAVAATGSVMLCSSESRRHSVAILPENHFALVHERQIVPHLEDAMIIAAQHASPQTVFVSGPSRTADIEQTLVLGAHGPLSVTIFVITDDGPAPF